jgi:CDP-paratose 2-epimerase
MANVLITGGAGFIGINYAARLLQCGHTVTLFDNLSRRGSKKNIDWIRKTFSNGLKIAIGDVRDIESVNSAVADQDAIFHFAAQVAVTESVRYPREDFEINAVGTFNVLEAARMSGRNPLVVYASTNKVYGGMDQLTVVESEKRWDYKDLPLGISEIHPLDFHSPYGCSKGAGDQYVRDYARIYGLPTVVFRQSCIYGMRQYGIEDQGWLAHFVISILKESDINIYGDGKQVRDILWVDDLLDAYDLVLSDSSQFAGRVFNIGGGSEFTVSIWHEMEPILSELSGRNISVIHNDWRPGDQKVYISDITLIEECGWKPKVDPMTGVSMLWNWVSDNLSLVS